MLEGLRSLGRTYALYWSGTLLMQLSTQVFLVIVAWQLTSVDSRSDYSFLIYVLSNLPFVILTFVAALLARRWTYRQVHVLGQVTMAAGVAVFIAYLGSGAIALSLAAVLIWHAGIALRGPAYQATIAAMFDGDRRSTAYAYHDVAVNVSRLVGPLTASWILAIGHPELWPVLAFAAILITMAAIGSGAGNTARDASNRPLVTRDPRAWRRLAFVLVAAGIFIAGTTLLPALVRQSGGAVTDLAILVSAASVGAILGSLLQGRVRHILRQWEKPVLAVLATASCLAMGLSTQMALWLAASFVSGAAAVIFFLRLKTDFLDLGAREESAGLLSAYFFASYLGYSLGALLWGALAQQSSPQVAFLAAAASTLVLMPALLTTATAPSRAPRAPS